MNAAADRWASQLAGWGIPDEILAAAPASPWQLPVELFSRYAEAAPARNTPAIDRALEALGDGGSVLDVGCGAGATSAPLVTKGVVDYVTGVDQGAGMLEAFARRMDDLGVNHREVEGLWPGVADEVEPADVVVCGHVLYNVGDVVPFAVALERNARRRIVIELTARHPRAWMTPLWRELWNLDRPDGPTPDDAIAALHEAGIKAEIERWEEPSHVPDAGSFELARRMMCLTKERDEELRAALERHPRPATRGFAAIWWDCG